MAMNDDQLLAPIESAIVTMAKEADECASRNYAGARTLANALRDLAEARAWIISPRQPHGGSGASAD